MVEKLKEVVNKLKTANKPVWLFAFLKMDEVTDRWTLVISAPWITEENQKDEFQVLAQLLRENLDKEELYSIARVGLLAKDNELTQGLLKKKSGDEVKDEAINGNVIHEGKIIESNPDLEWPRRTLSFS